MFLGIPYLSLCIQHLKFLLLPLSLISIVLVAATVFLHMKLEQTLDICPSSHQIFSAVLPSLEIRVDFCV